jgi:S-formylglutathione hydrolase FrmB
MKKVISLVAWVAITLGTTGQNYDFFDTSFYSPVLDETKSMRIYLPPGYTEDTISYPVVYYLHGAGGSYLEVTPHLQDIQNMIDTGYIHPMLVVGLDGQCQPFDGSMYTNSVLYGNYEDYTIQDAIPFAESVLRTKNSSNYRCIMGFAMGGYGSMKFACKHSELFAGIASYNGVLQFDTTLVLWQPEVISENPGPPYNYQYGAGIFTNLLFTAAGAFSPNLNILPYQVEFIYDTMGVQVDSIVEKWKEYDCSRLVKDMDTISYNHPGLFFTCGINDFLYFYPTNTCFADTLDDLGIDYEFLTTDDGHILSDEMLQAGMYFLDSVMHDSILVRSIEYGSPKSNTLSIYPNPSSGYITIETSVTQTLSHLSIMNLNGKIFIHRKITEPKTILDIRNLHRGVYFCCLFGDQVAIEKIIKL